MRQIERLIDAAKARQGLKSDAEVAKALGLSKGAVSLWRGGGVITEKNLAELIALAEADPAVAVVVLREQAQTPAQEAVWGALRGRLMPIMSTATRALRAAVGLPAQH